MVEAIPYCNEIIVATGWSKTYNRHILQWLCLLLQYMIFIAMKIFVTKTYCHGVYYNNLQRLTFITIKVYCNEKFRCN